MPRAKKAKNVTAKPHWLLNEKTAPPIVALGLMVVVIILTLVFHLLTKPAAAPTTNTNRTTKTQPNLAIMTEDEVTLAGQLTYPSGAGPFPVVILVHEFGQDHHQWDAYRDTFVGAGLAVLAYDTRGFGDSSLASVPGAQATFFGSMPLDVIAAVKYAQRQSKIDDERIHVIGAALGANIAYVISGSQAGVAKTVLLSPGVSPQLDGSAVTNFTPTNVYGIASPTDQSVLETLMAKVGEPKKTTIVTESTSHGAALLQNSDVLNAVQAWLAD